MSKKKEETDVTSAQTGTVTQTATETEREAALTGTGLARVEAGASGATGLQDLGQSLVEALISGEELPGAFGDLFGGIGEEQAASIAQRSVEQQASNESFQAGGLLDSGVRQSIQSRIRGETLTNVAQSNLDRRLQLLGIGIGAQQGFAGQQLSQETVLGERLAGLRTQTEESQFNASQFSKFTGPNPFLESFQRSLGTSLGTNIGSTSPSTLLGKTK